MEKIDQLISLAQKAGKISSGEFSVEKSVRSGLAHLLIVTKDASVNTKKKFYHMSAYYHVPIIEYSTKERMGHLMGRDLRSIASIEDEGFAKALQSNRS